MGGAILSGAAVSENQLINFIWPICSHNKIIVRLNKDINYVIALKSDTTVLDCVGHYSEFGRRLKLIILCV